MSPTDDMDAPARRTPGGRFGGWTVPDFDTRDGDAEQSTVLRGLLLALMLTAALWSVVILAGYGLIEWLI